MDADGCFIGLRVASGFAGNESSSLQAAGSAGEIAARRRSLAEIAPSKARVIERASMAVLPRGGQSLAASKQT